MKEKIENNREKLMKIRFFEINAVDKYLVRLNRGKKGVSERYITIDSTDRKETL